MTTSEWAGGFPGLRSTRHRRGGRSRARTALAMAGCAATFAVSTLVRRRSPGTDPYPGERLVRGASVVGGLALGAALAAHPAIPQRVGRVARFGALGAAAGLSQGGSHVLFDLLGALFRRAIGSADPDAPGADAGRVAVRSLALGSAALALSAAGRQAADGVPPCVRCGRPAPDGRLRAPSWSGYAAVALSLPYPVVKLAWECGSDVGMTQPEVIHNIPGGWVPVLPALAGSVLSLALVQPWGRVFPRWVPVVGGSRVPRLLVLGPACFGTALLAQVGPAAFMSAVRQYFGPQQACADDFGLRPWVPLTFYASWMLWGAALGAAAWEYHRTTAGCPACALGHGPWRSPAVAGGVRTEGTQG
ncbi:hypothetical protein OG535_07150 [Kitasatospora sp. NBC_00085]|uniref:hypothetical protein n=1 Tax=unclassified Kitasatospora TaxID=2633591 RepID=UPI00325189C9